MPGLFGDPTPEAEGEFTLGDAGSESDGEESVGSEPSGEGLSAGSEDAGPVFYDASKVPEELRPSFREMQKAWTQSQQRAAEERRQLAAERSQLADAAGKASVLDQLLQRQEFVDLLYTLQANDANPASASRTTDLPPGMDPEMAATVKQWMAQQMQQMQQAIAQATQPVANRQAKVEAILEKEAFVKSHPDWEQYRELMGEAFQRNRSNPNFTYEDAYRWARGSQALVQQAATTRAASLETRAVERPGATRPAPRAQKVETFRDAVSAALAELGVNPKTL